MEEYVGKENMSRLFHGKYRCLWSRVQSTIIPQSVCRDVSGAIHFSILQWASDATAVA